MTRAPAALLLLLACSGRPAADPHFGPGFLWGAAIAGFQVDLGCPTLDAAACEDRNSDWYQLITHPNELSDLSSTVTFEPPSHGPGHWEKWEGDLDLAHGLSLNGLRTSIEWSRVFPAATDAADGYDALKALADPAALAWYHALFEGLKARGLKPLVTLNHYTLPLWIHDGLACHQSLATCTARGWLDAARTQREIVKYAGFVAREFGGEVDLWATENEPFAVVLPGYLFPSSERVNPPALSYRYDEAKAVLLALIEAHAKMYDAVKANDTADADADGTAAEVGLVYATVPVRPADAGTPLDVKAASNVFYLYNTVFLDGVCRGDVDPELDGKSVHRDELAGRMDWVGVNYYTPISVVGTPQATFPTLSPLTNFDPVALSSLTYVDDPHGLYEVVKHVHDRYRLPVIVTENGTAVDDAADSMSKVPRWITRNVSWLREAATDGGADVRGYFYWTLFDNYEWNHGMSVRMGLYAVDPQDPTKARVKRPGADTLKAIAAENGVPASLAETWPR